MVDRIRSKDGGLECRRCGEGFNLEERKPVLLSCGDTLCDLCYDECLIEGGRRLKCPFEQDKVVLGKLDRRFRPYDEEGIIARLRAPPDDGRR
jgi:hypothetical protein